MPIALDFAQNPFDQSIVFLVRYLYHISKMNRLLIVPVWNEVDNYILKYLMCPCKMLQWIILPGVLELFCKSYIQIISTVIQTIEAVYSYTHPRMTTKSFPTTKVNDQFVFLLEVVLWKLLDKSGAKYLISIQVVCLNSW